MQCQHFSIFSATVTPFGNPCCVKILRRSTRQLRLLSTAASFGLPHDVGGDESAYGSLAPAINNADKLADWELRCHSLLAVLAVKKLVSTDGLRRAIESLTPAQHSSWTYYEKWSAGMTILLQEQGIISPEDLDIALFGERIQEYSSSEPVFAVGDFVRVRSYRREGLLLSGIDHM